MNRLIDDLDQIIEDKNKSTSVYFWLKENNLLHTENVDQYNRFRNNLKLKPKCTCNHESIVHAAGLSTCYDCGEEF